MFSRAVNKARAIARARANTRLGWICACYICTPQTISHVQWHVSEKVACAIKLKRRTHRLTPLPQNSNIVAYSKPLWMELPFRVALWKLVHLPELLEAQQSFLLLESYAKIMVGDKIIVYVSCFPIPILGNFRMAIHVMKIFSIINLNQDVR